MMPGEQRGEVEVGPFSNAVREDGAAKSSLKMRVRVFATRTAVAPTGLLLISHVFV